MPHHHCSVNRFGKQHDGCCALGGMGVGGIIVDRTASAKTTAMAGQPTSLQRLKSPISPSAFIEETRGSSTTMSEEEHLPLTPTVALLLAFGFPPKNTNGIIKNGSAGVASSLGDSLAESSIIPNVMSPTTRDFFGRCFPPLGSSHLLIAHSRQGVVHRTTRVDGSSADDLTPSSAVEARGRHLRLESPTVHSMLTAPEGDSGSSEEDDDVTDDEVFGFDVFAHNALWNWPSPVLGNHHHEEAVLGGGHGDGILFDTPSSLFNLRDIYLLAAEGITLRSAAATLVAAPSWLSALLGLAAHSGRSLSGSADRSHNHCQPTSHRQRNQHHQSLRCPLTLALRSAIASKDVGAVRAAVAALLLPAATPGLPSAEESPNNDTAPHACRFGLNCCGECQLDDDGGGGSIAPPHGQLHTLPTLSPTRQSTLAANSSHPHIAATAATTATLEFYTPLQEACLYGNASRYDNEGRYRDGREVGLADDGGADGGDNNNFAEEIAHGDIAVSQRGADGEFSQRGDAISALRRPHPSPPRSKAYQMVALLISEGADVSRLSADGDTALHLCWLLDLDDVAQLLMDNGCDPAVINRHGQTAHLTAESSQRQLLADVIARELPVVPSHLWDRSSRARSPKPRAMD